MSYFFDSMIESKYHPFSTFILFAGDGRKKYLWFLVTDNQKPPYTCNVIPCNPLNIMTITQLKSAIDCAINKMAAVDLEGRNTRRYVAVYADGSISPVLDQHTLEAKKPAVLCKIGPWWSGSYSTTRNATNKREAKQYALQAAEFAISERDAA
ncbi:hypothetical protein KLP40_14465 [Hymenobacter sp. NST-14]|uniref:hypothetical protein n=1 Tax=Hymenobacter piscis TaxID=2839984 RepID=UPI001C025043|nr:hypothetical protein [Hymenobacter piscis]MBT9394371.1 hypothetical protein [Hymenobacter piscis]